MENKNFDFSTCQVQDLLNNDSFVHWILQPDEKLDNFWQNIIAAYPDLSTKVTSARRIILSLQFNTDTFDPEEKDALWKSIYELTGGRRKLNVIPTWLKAAAIFIGILLTVSIYIYQNRDISLSTEYGQVKTIRLPDSSEVTLNANSQLKYPAKWKKDQPRQVWINGEAFFKVVHLHRKGNVTPGERFIVHAGKVNVEVLGTTFNVSERRNNIVVELVTGKVEFSLNKNHKQAVVLGPGEQIQYMGQLDTIIKKNANGMSHADWKNGVLHFKNTNLIEVFQYIDDVYGYQAVLKNPRIAERKISGDFSNNSFDGLVKALAVSLNLSIRKSSLSHQLIVNE